MLTQYLPFLQVRSHAYDLKKQCYQSINVQASESEEEVFTSR